MRRSAASPPPGAPPPGAPQTSGPNLLVGVYATITLTGLGTLHLFDWELRFRQSLVDVTAHGDEWEQWKPLRQGWTLRARGYLSRSAPATDTYYGAGALDRSAAGDELTLTCYSDMGTTIIFTGTCYAEDITLNVPNVMVEQEITVRGNAAPTAGPRA